MANTTQNQENEQATSADQKMAALKTTDLPDNEHDEERMQPEEVVLDLPDVSEIPGQEHVHVPQIREMQDVTIASDDEEGVGIFGDDDEEDELFLDDEESDVSATEKGLLETSATDMPTEDNEMLRKAALDDMDEDGDLLNEGSTATDVTGSDIDTGGLDEDDAMEEIGEEDEENNMYSAGGDDNNSLEESKE